MPAVFGYGSLILPTSLVGRFGDFGPLSPIYDAGRRYEDDDLLRSAAVEAWEREYADRIDYYPVRVDGLRRVYSHPSPRGGLMLDAYRDDDAWCNGVVVTGLTAAEVEAITGSESGYDVVERSTADMDPYAAAPPETTVSLYAAPDEVSVPSDQAPNWTYHDRIRRGIDWLGDGVADEFRTDFERTTYAPDGDELVALAD